MPNESLLKRPTSSEGLWLATVAMADLLTTLYWVSQGQAREGNPFMAQALAAGVGPFITVKLLLTVPAILVLEWYRSRRPDVVRRLQRLTLSAYLMAYSASLLAQSGRLTAILAGV